MCLNAATRKEKGARRGASDAQLSPPIKLGSQQLAYPPQAWQAGKMYTVLCRVRFIFTLSAGLVSPLLGRGQSRKHNHSTLLYFQLAVWHHEDCGGVLEVNKTRK